MKPMMKWQLCMLLFLLFSLAPLVVSAQSDDEGKPEEDACPVIVREAIDRAKLSCAGVGSNQVCYGHSTLQAGARPGIDSFNFEAPGDIEDVITMQSLSLSAMDAAREIWGVVMMNVQASLETSDQKDVTFIVFGDTDLESRASFAEVMTTEDVRLRSGPGTDTEQVTVVLEGQTVQANGRTEDGTWVRVRIPGEVIQNGWVSADFVELVDGSLDDLEVVTEDSDNSAVRYGPMQAFYFQSGRDDAPCPEAPNSGMLIQTPEGEATVTLLIDEVIIELDATAYIQAEPNGELTVNILEGQATFTSQGESVTAVAGTRVAITLDEDLGAASAPSDPEAYDPDDLQSLPLDALPREIEVVDPLDVQAGVPAPGTWQFVWGVEEMTCEDGTVFPFAAGAPSALQISADGAAISYGNGSFTRASTGVYTRAYIDQNSNLIQDTLLVQGLDRIAGESIIEVAATPCTLVVPFSLQRVG